MSWREKVIEEARTWKGTPYQHKGRIKGVGVDCGGLLWCVYNQFFGPLKPFPKDYSPDWALHQGREIYQEFLEQYMVHVLVPKPGGVALFKVGRCWSHGAIITEKRTFIHAWGRNQQGGVVEWKRGKFRIAESNQLRPVMYYDLAE